MVVLVCVCVVGDGGDVRFARRRRLGGTVDDARRDVDVSVWMRDYMRVVDCVRVFVE